MNECLGFSLSVISTHAFCLGLNVLLKPREWCNFYAAIFMAALRCRCGHYIFVLWFLSFFFFYSSPNLSGCRLDVYHTSTHGVALVRI